MATKSLYDPFEQWNRMDNYLKSFFIENPIVELGIQNTLKGFLFQYLGRVANMDREEAAIWGRNISPWRSGRNDYQRSYHNDNPLIKSIEFEISKRLELKKREILLINDQELLDEFKRYGEEFMGQRFLKVPSPAEYERFFEMVVRRGYTPSLQEAAVTAARLNLEMINPTYKFPEKESFFGGFNEFLADPIYTSFKHFAISRFSSSVVVDLLEGFSSVPPDSAFAQKGISSLLQDSYGRVLHYLSESMKVPFSSYSDLHRFENCIEMIYEEMIFWLMVAEPYPQGELERVIQQVIQPAPFFRTTLSGMTAFSEIIKVVLGEESTVLYFDDCYFECLVSIKGENSYPIRFPDYEASLDQALDQLNGRKIDLLFVDFHNNFLPGKLSADGHDVKAIVSKLQPFFADTFTIIIDNTIGFLKSVEVNELLEAFPKRNVIVYWSHQKFDMFGSDKLSGGSYAVYSQDAGLLAKFRGLKGGEIDPVSRQGLTHFFTYGADKMDERRRKIFSNTRYVYERINPRTKYLVKKGDLVSFSIDVQQPWDIEQEITILKEFENRGVPVMTRLSFGFNTISSTLIRNEGMRISMGIEDPEYLDQFVAAFNSIFPVEPITSEGVGESIDEYLNRS